MALTVAATSLQTVCLQSARAGLPAIDAYNIGRYHLNAGQYAAAAKSFTEALMMNPRYAAAYLGRGRAYSKLGQYNLALDDLAVAVRMLPKYAGAYATRAEAKAGLGHYDEAMADLDEAVSLDPKSAQALYQRSQVHAALGQLPSASVDLNEALSLDPFIESRQQSMQEAAKITRDAAPIPSKVPAVPMKSPLVQASSRNPTALMSSAPTFYESIPAAPVSSSSIVTSGSIGPRMAPVQRTVVVPRSGPALLPHVTSIANEQMSMVREMAPELVPAAPTVPQQLEKLPQLESVPQLEKLSPPQLRPATEDASPATPEDRKQAARKRLERGQQLLQSGDDVAACAELTVSLAFDPELTEARLQRGLAYLKSGRYQTALDDLSIVIDTQPTAEAYRARSQVYEAMKRTTEAHIDLDAAASLDPTSAEARVGQIERMHRPIPVLSPAEKALMGDPAHDYFERGRFEMSEGQYQRAVANLSVALRLRSDYPEALAARGKALTALGRWREALADLDAALLEYPGAADLYCARAKVAIGLHEFQPADDDVAIALRLDPQSTEAQRLRTSLDAIAPEPTDIATSQTPQAHDLPAVGPMAPEEPALPARRMPRGQPVTISDDAPPAPIEPQETLDVQVEPIPQPDDAAPQVSTTQRIDRIEVGEDNEAPPAPPRIAIGAGARSSTETSSSPPARVTIDETPRAMPEPVETPRTVRLHVEARAATKAQTDAVQFRIPVNADPDTRDVRPIETTPAPSDVESATGGEQAVEVETSDAAEPIADETPQDAPTYLDRGESLASSARLNDAIAAYDRALELDPKLVDAYVGRGFVLAHTGASEAAIDNFAAALRLAPNHPRAHFGLGRALRQQGHYAEAVAHLERAIQLNPELGSAYVELIRAQRAWEVSIEAARAAQQ